MSRWRLIVLGVLVAIPPLVLIAAGSFYFWKEHLWFAVWWPMAACLTAAYLLGWWWQRKSRLLPPVDFKPQFHWTERDREAWRLVEARVQAAKDIPTERFTQFPFYVEIAQSMAQELARFYHPNAADPVEWLTIPEVLAVTELASHDLAEMVDEYLPGGHLLTIRNWRQAGRVSEWYNRASNAYWAIAAVFSPVNTALRYSASKLGLSRPFQMLQANVLAWFYTAFVHRVGTYLIDLNSGRLRVGAKRYRDLVQRRERMEATSQRSPNEPGPASPEEAAPVGDASRAAAQVTTLAILGQVKAGKSSLINALLGERRAVADVLPATNAVTRYQLRAPVPQPAASRHHRATDGPPSPADGAARSGNGDKLELLDTVGYGYEGPKADQLAATCEAVQQADLALLVLNARDPARQPDLDLLKRLRDWFGARPHLKMPRILAVVTHIDLLPPALEWSPPYDWLDPKRPKEKNIAEALAVIRDQLGSFLVGVVPVCTVEGKVFGIEEALLPRLAEQLDEARAVAMLRCLHAEADAGKARRVFHQLLHAGKQLVRAAMGT